jgi:hypothetical protein
VITFQRYYGRWEKRARGVLSAEVTLRANLTKDASLPER